MGEAAPPSATPREGRRSVLSKQGCLPRLGLLLGDPDQLTEAASDEAAQALSRTLSRAGDVIPYRGPWSKDCPEALGAMIRYLEQVDVLWAGTGHSQGTELALQVRRHSNLDRPMVLLASDSTPRGLQAMLLPWQNLLRPGDGIVFNGGADLDLWRRLTDARNMVEAIVPPPFEADDFQPPSPSQKVSARIAYGLPMEGPLLFHPGRLAMQENVHTVLHVLAQVRRCFPSAHLVLSGAEHDAPLPEFGVRNTGYAAWLRRLAGDLGLEGAVTFLGPLPATDLACVQGAADLALNLGFPHERTHGLDLVRSLACGVPVISSDWGNRRDVVPNDTGGFRVASVLTSRGIRIDCAAAAQRAVEVLKDQALRARLSKGAAAYAAHRFSEAAAGRALKAIANHLLETRRPGLGPAYKPSELAVRYELHQRACGWHDPSEVPPRTLFQGRDYQLYQDVFGCYATWQTGLADFTAVPAAAVPHRGPFVRLDPDRQLGCDEDPIWYHRRFLDRESWEVLRQVDGQATVGDLAALTGIGLDQIRKTLWALQADGFVLLSRDSAHPHCYAVGNVAPINASPVSSG